MFKDALKSLLESINTMLETAYASDMFSSSLEGWQSGAFFNTASDVLNGASHAVALTILALCFTLELLRLSTKTEGMHQGTMSVEIIFRVLFKMVLCKTAVDWTERILMSIYNTSISFIGSINPTGSGTGTLLNLTALNVEIDGLKTGEQISMLLVSVIVWLMVALVILLVNAICIGRFIEIYVMLAVAPIPIATLANDELSGIGKNFLKSFTAVCIQGLFIYIVLMFIPALFEIDLNLFGDSTNTLLKLISMVFYSIVIVLAVFQTQKWAKSVCNAV